MFYEDAKNPNAGVLGAKLQEIGIKEHGDMGYWSQKPVYGFVWK